MNLIEELSAVCQKHGVVLVGTCGQEGIYGEITIMPAQVSRCTWDVGVLRPNVLDADNEISAIGVFVDDRNNGLLDFMVVGLREPHEMPARFEPGGTPGLRPNEVAVVLSHGEEVITVSRAARMLLAEQYEVADFRQAAALLRDGSENEYTACALRAIEKALNPRPHVYWQALNPRPHVYWQAGEPGTPSYDRNDEGLCKVCGQGEADLEDTCPGKRGMKLVPIEPTPEMLAAGDGWCQFPRQTWAAMLGEALPLVDGVPTIDLDAIAWHDIKKAASESTWMPPEYMANDWTSDVVDFLRNGPAFKAYVHQRLDAMGVPHSLPESEHDKAGCRVGGRLDWVEARLPTAALQAGEA